jgi:hypothetical protein
MCYHLNSDNNTLHLTPILNPGEEDLEELGADQRHQGHLGARLHPTPYTLEPETPTILINDTKAIWVRTYTLHPTP